MIKETQQVTADQVKEPEPTAADDGWGNSWGDEANEFEVEETKDGDGATGGGGGWNEDSWNDSWNETSNSSCHFSCSRIKFILRAFKYFQLFSKT